VSTITTAARCASCHQPSAGCCCGRGDPLAVKDSIAALRRYSLISPAADGAVSVHRLVQAVTGDLMSPELAEEWRRAAAALIEAAIPAAPGDPQAWPTFAALLPHAQTALAAGRPGMERIAAFVGFSGSYAAARALQQKVLGARLLALGAGDPLSLTARSNLAYWTRGGGGRSRGPRPACCAAARVGAGTRPRASCVPDCTG
jgi:hypothetical protein